MALLVGNVALPADDAGQVGALAAALGVPAAKIGAWQLVRNSLDARSRPPVRRGVFRVELPAADEAKVVARQRPGVRAWTAKDDARYGVTEPGEATAEPGSARALDAAGASDSTGPTGPNGSTASVGARGDVGRVIVVGAGPAGLFAALYLAEAGIPVLLLDRGGDTAARVNAVNGFWRRKLPLDPENNILFGEGGAGTFSDGKIYTRRRDAEIGWVLRRFVDFGARPEILSEGWAHLGTDKVREILPVFRARLRELGAEVRYGARVDDLLVADGRVHGVRLGDGSEERGTHVIFAPGHSARDAVTMLVERGAAAEPRSIAIGARVEHPQAVIDRARYGVDARGELPPSSYRLAWNPRHGAKARTFCMCPGGMVVPANNQEGRVVVNGMSFAAQRSFWANSAVIVEVEPSVYAGQGRWTGPLAGYAWQDAIEQRAFELAGGDYTAPGQRVEDLLAGVVSSELPKVSYPFGARAVDLRAVMPEQVIAGMVGALRYFGHKLDGFDRGDAVLMAPETRTTSPVGFVRTEAGESVSLRGLYPCGEGAGYGGGIVSCALDGIRVAKAIAGD